MPVCTRAMALRVCEPVPCDALPPAPAASEALSAPPSPPLEPTPALVVAAPPRSPALNPTNASTALKASTRLALDKENVAQAANSASCAVPAPASDRAAAAAAPAPAAPIAAPPQACAAGLTEAQLAKAVKEGWNVSASAGQGEMSYPPTDALEAFAGGDAQAVERLCAAPKALSGAADDWLAAAEALAEVRRAAARHASVLVDAGAQAGEQQSQQQPGVHEQQEGNEGGEEERVVTPLVTLLPLVAKLVKNPRSSLARVACLCAADLFKAHANVVLATDEGSRLLDELLNKAAHAKRFLAEEAAAALSVMSETAAPSVAMRAACAKAAKAKAPKVRARAAECLQAAAPRAAGSELLADMAELLPCCAKLLVDKEPASRASARAVLPALCAAVKASDAHWEAVCVEQLSPAAARDVLKAT